MVGGAQSATIPVNTTVVSLSAEFGDLRYVLSGTASNVSAGYLPAGTVENLYLNQLSTLSIYGPTGSFANLLYL
jgi:hypothetical protein